MVSNAVGGCCGKGLVVEMDVRTDAHNSPKKRLIAMHYIIAETVRRIACHFRARLKKHVLSSRSPIIAMQSTISEELAWYPASSS